MWLNIKTKMGFSGRPNFSVIFFCISGFIPFIPFSQSLIVEGLTPSLSANCLRVSFFSSLSFLSFSPIFCFMSLMLSPLS